jgi:nucleotide-binding universal stress UspA family protein
MSIRTATPPVIEANPIESPFKKILVAVVRRNAVAPIRAAAMLAKPGVSRVKVLHLQERVTTPGRSIPLEIETYAEAIDFVDKIYSELRELGIEAETQLGREYTGREAKQILIAAYDFGADLLIASNRHKSRFDEILRGNTTRNIVRLSTIALMLVPETP